MVQRKGFTLIELIIVIALIALLATTVILVINPVKIFKEARDSQRIADIGQMNSALSLYAGTAAVPAFGTCTTTCYSHLAGVGANCQSRYVGNGTAVISTGQKTDGTGWIPVDLGGTSGGAPLSAWPVDPKPTLGGSATSSYFYSYACDASNQWEFTAHMESTRYASSGTDDVESTDGGNKQALFEVGTNVQL